MLGVAGPSNLHLIVTSAFSGVETHADAVQIGKSLPQYSSHHATSVFNPHCHKSDDCSLVGSELEHVCQPEKPGSFI